MHETAQFVIRHGYAVLFFWVLAEQGALPIPSVPLLLVCGALAKAGDLSVAPILFFGVLACLISDSAWFQLGRSRGRKILGFLCRVAIEPDSCVRETESGFVRYGVRFLLVSKFIPGMNAMAAPLAGTSRVGWGLFLVFDALGAVFFISSWATIGYLFSNQLEDIGNMAGLAGFRLFLFILVVTGGWIGWKYFQRKRFFKKLAMARIPALELKRMLDDGEDVVVIDVRGFKPEGPGSAADQPIPGALRIPLSQLATRQHEVPRDRDIVLFCT
jgi:membrane protein DedA with SNARE-associated domain